LNLTTGPDADEKHREAPRAPGKRQEKSYLFQEFPCSFGFKGAAVLSAQATPMGDAKAAFILKPFPNSARFRGIRYVAESRNPTTAFHFELVMPKGPKPDDMEQYGIEVIRSTEGGDASAQDAVDPGLPLNLWAPPNPGTLTFDP